MEQKISAAFHRLATIDAEKITVDVLGSKVILKGTARLLAERKDAGDDVRTAPGVAAVANRLSGEQVPIL